ncbi:MAG: GTP-binding protein [Pseudoalteromonas tetraodonis]|jgi:GTP-binding protein
MLPTIALVGRPNVGKSTLFNFLTRSRDALVADFPGLTRDRQYGFAKRGDSPFILCDTGGISGDSVVIDEKIAVQAQHAISEADAILFLVDAREGLNFQDQAIANHLRRLGKPIRLAVNKAEGMDTDMVEAEYFSLGLGQPNAVSAAHGEGAVDLINALLEELPDGEPEPESDEHSIKVAVVGRPNAGKSTLLNRMLGEERVVASDVAGTTRDSIYIPFVRDDQKYTLIDTAGIRRRARVDLAIEHFSVQKALQAIDSANVVIAVLDAHEEIAEQDARLIGMVVERGRALVIAVNKWDGLDQYDRDQIKRQLELRLPFATFARLHFISALHGSGVGDLFASIRAAHKAAYTVMPTPDLTRLLEAAIEAHPPPAVTGQRIKMRYAHQGGTNPPIIVIHGNRTNKLNDSYKRYLVNYFREAFDLWGTPIRIELRNGTNPFEGRKNKPKNAAQMKQARRLKRVAKSKARDL